MSSGERFEKNRVCLTGFTSVPCPKDVEAQRRRGEPEGQPGALFFSLIPEVTRRGGLSKVVKSICSREGGKEKRLVARGKEHKGKIVHREHCSPRVV